MAEMISPGVYLEEIDNSGIVTGSSSNVAVFITSRKALLTLTSRLPILKTLSTTTVTPTRTTTMNGSSVTTSCSTARTC